MPSQDLARRAVVTGMGAVTPIGNDAETYWTNLLAGKPGGGPITTFDTAGHDVKIAAEVRDFDATVAMDRKMARRMSRFIHFAMAAAAEAVERSGIDFEAKSPEERDRCAVIINTGGGGMEQVIEGSNTIRDKGPGQVSPFAIPALSGSMAAAQVSMRYGLTGPVITQVAACASGVIAFQDALRLIATGECEVIVAGGSEAPLLAMAFAALGNMGALSKRNDDPEGASRPFDRTRDGFVFGEKMAEFITPIAILGEQMSKFTTEIGFKGFQNPDEVGAAAVDYLRVAGHLVFGYFWARMAQVALREIAAGNTDQFYVAKLQTARFYFAKLFPETATLMRTARTGSKVLMDTDAALA